MILKKKIIPVIIASAPFFTSSLFGSDKSHMSLEDLKQHCLELRQNDQVKPFNIKIECKGNWTYWENESHEISLTNTSTLRAKTATKCGRFETPEQMFERELDDQTMQCDVMTKKEVSSPEGMGIPVRIGSCDELNMQNVEDLCRERVVNYCQDNMDENIADQEVENHHQDQQRQEQTQQSSSGEGLCKLRTLETINTCDSYM